MFRILSVIMLSFMLSSSAFALSVDQAVKSALKNNYEVLSSAHKAESAKYTAKAAQTPYYPQVNAGYAYQHSSEKAYGYITDKISTFNLSVGYNLFNGFTDLFNQKAAKNVYIADKYNTDAVKQDIKLSVRKAYINVLSAEDAINVANNAVKLLENQLKDVKLYYDVGYVAKNQVLKVEAELSSNQQNVLSANSNLRMAIYSLEKLTGLKIPENEKFEPVEGIDIKLPNTNNLKETMFKNRSEIKYLRRMIEAKQYSIKAKKGGYLPKVNAGVNYYTYGENTWPTGRDYTYDKETVFSVSVDMNLFDGLNKYNTTKSLEADKLQLMSTLGNTRAGMVLQLKDAVESFKLAHASLATAEKELTSAKENYRITKNQYLEKVATTTDLMDARYMLTRAKNTYSNAKFNILRALADIERITEKDL